MAWSGSTISIAGDASAAATATMPVVARPINPAAHVAVITWDVGPAGLVPVARSHFEMPWPHTAAVTLEESRIEQNAVLLPRRSRCSSLAGLALAVMPWLLVGGTLALHHPFGTTRWAFLAQCTAQAEQAANVGDRAGHVGAAARPMSRRCSIGAPASRP